MKNGNFRKCAKLASVNRYHFDLYNGNVARQKGKKLRKKGQKMTYLEFRNALKSVGLSNIKFANLVGIHKNSMTIWKQKNSVPIWVKPFLEYYAKALKYDFLVENLDSKILQLLQDSK